MEKEIRRHIRLALSENMQLADKMYFSTGKLSEEDKDFALYLTDGKPNQYTKLICDILYYLKEHDWMGNYKSSAQAAANNALEYKKNVLPIKEWDIYKAENKIGNLISSLESRHAILAILEELPSVLRRNLSAELRIPRDSKELSELKRLYEYFSEQISGVYHLNPERRDEILKKLITSKNNTIDRLTDWMDDSDNLIGSAWDSVDKIHEILDEHYGEGEVVAENERWLVVKVESAELMKSLGCNSQWCFSMPLSSQFDQYQHNGIVYWMVKKNDLNSQYVLIGPGDDRLFDRENNSEEGNPYMYLFRWGVPDIESLDFDDARPGGEPMRQIEDAREEWRQENSKNPRVQQLSLDLAESRRRGKSVPVKVNDSRIYLSQDGNDGFGYKMGVHLKTDGTKIGSVVFRRKNYLKDKGFPEVLELHLGFEEEYQQQGFFQDVLLELYGNTETPIYLANGRIINKNVFKAINKLDKSRLDVLELPGLGFIVKTKETLPLQESIESIPQDYQYDGEIDSLGYTTLYHGGVALPEDGILRPGDIFFMTPDIELAQNYADIRGGEVFTIKVKPEDVNWNTGTGEVELEKGGSIIDMGGFWKIFT